MRVTRGKEEGRLTRERTGPTYERKGEHDKKTYSPCSLLLRVWSLHTSVSVTHS